MGAFALDTEKCALLLVLCRSVCVCVCKQFVDVWPTPGDVHGGGEGLQHRAGHRHAFVQAQGDG